ncbi:MAG: ABC transporter ATP-binding protein [Candidatus Acidiferrales bacterium]
MTDAVIRVEGIGKRYQIGERAQQGALLRDVIANAFRRNGQNGGRRSSRDSIWAVRDVSFDVKQGEVVGLIGRNGAGKSTLLKILARITRPTVGYAELRGRIASLLEVGTGFHAELTGRENVFLSGAILGMSKAEITRKFDEIVAFAEVERFIDTPIKHYSSGMGMRLAFAVAAHLEPEILLVDEVLSVGDASFQKKCLGKMQEVSRGGRTILFVSHNMGAVNALCARCMILDSGVVDFDGSSSEAAARYCGQFLDAGDGSDLSDRPRKGSGKARFTSISVQPTDSLGQPVEIPFPGCNLTVNLELKCESDFAPANLAVIFYDSNGYRVIDTNTAQQAEFVSLRAGQTARASFFLRDVLLRPGKYLIGLWLGRPGMEEIDDIEYAMAIDFMDSTETSRHSETFPGMYLCRFEQSVVVNEAEVRGVNA